jgi:CheY-like chemotaxis protein
MPEETDVRIKIDFIDEQLRVAIEDNNEIPPNNLLTDSLGDEEIPRKAQYSPMIRPMRGGPFDTVLATTDPGRKVFVASVPAQRVSDTVDAQRIVEEIEEEEEIKPRPKILFYETAIDRKIALERIFMIELRLGYHFEICTDGRQILDRVKTLFEETDYNQVALVVIDVKMPELVGSEVITQTR